MQFAPSSTFVPLEGPRQPISRISRAPATSMPIPANLT